MQINRRRLKNLFVYGILILVAFVLLLPAIWLVVTSLKAESEYMSGTLQLWPTGLHWENYVTAVTEIDFLRYVKNSVVLSTMFALLTVATSSMAGFAFARIPAPGRAKLFAIVVAMILIPVSIYVIPQFVLLAKIKVVGSYWPWVLWGLAGSPFHIFLFRQFFTAFPKELEDAAEVDGASTFRIYWQVVLPNAKPVLATSFILSFLYVWGDWFLPLIYLTDKNTTLSTQLIVSYTDPQGYPAVTPTVAASMLYLLPPVVIFFLAERYITKGIVTTGLRR